MNIHQLQEEYDRLCQRIKALNQQPASSIDSSEWRELVENLESLTSAYRHQLAEEIDIVPARLIRRRTVRPKYACPCGEAGVAVAALPPRLIPQSKLGLGLAVFIVLARFDDHLSYYRLEQQFRERHGVEIPRQQMVQWIEHIANWLTFSQSSTCRTLQNLRKPAPIRWEDRGALHL
jgi:hypothetical protein